jgi:hypothetical protein
VKWLKNSVFWDVTPCGSCKNTRFGRTYCLHRKNVSSNYQLKQGVSAVSYSFLPRSLIFSTLMMEPIRSAEMSVITRGTRRNIPEEGVLHSRRRKNSDLA